jgi:hypothetical protein
MDLNRSIRGFFILAPGTYILGAFYLVLKNLILPRNAGSSMGHARPALRESEFSGFALEFCV